MTYHPLTKESGGDDKARIEEARRIVRILEEFMDSDKLSEKDKQFLTEMTDCDFCTTKQLFYLRDIKDKVI